MQLLAWIVSIFVSDSRKKKKTQFIRKSEDSSAFPSTIKAEPFLTHFFHNHRDCSVLTNGAYPKLQGRCIRNYQHPLNSTRQRGVSDSYQSTTEFNNDPVPSRRSRPGGPTGFLHQQEHEWTLCVWKQGSKGGNWQRRWRKRKEKIHADPGHGLGTGMRIALGKGDLPREFKKNNWGMRAGITPEKAISQVGRSAFKLY